MSLSNQAYTNKEILDFSQLWIEEKQLLFDLASKVDCSGTIVEIGTAQGGSGAIFYRAAGVRGTKIYSYDISPSKEAYHNLKDTNVKIIAKASLEGFKDWEKEKKGLIDLLFIDGSHALEHVFQDFNHWVKFLKPGGTVVCHDYDPIERGGLIHLGTRIFIDTILRKRILKDCFHHGRIVYGIIEDPKRTKVQEGDCFDTFFDLAARIKLTIEDDYTDWMILGEGQLISIIKNSLNAGNNLRAISKDDITFEGKYVVLSRPLMPTLKILNDKGVSPKQIRVLDNLFVCYAFAYGLKQKRDYFLSLLSSRKDFFKWEEALFMFEHTVGQISWPYQHTHDNQIAIEALSKIVAFEQVRLLLLTKLLELFIEEKL